MKNLKLFFVALVAAASLFVMGCMTMVPVSDNASFPADASTYTVLGRVELSSSAMQSGYSKLYDAALKQYPDADDVVNIKIDSKTTTLLFIFSFQTYEMSGIAIKYN